MDLENKPVAFAAMVASAQGGTINHAGYIMMGREIQKPSLNTIISNLTIMLTLDN